MFIVIEHEDVGSRKVPVLIGVGVGVGCRVYKRGRVERRRGLECELYQETR